MCFNNQIDCSCPHTSVWQPTRPNINQDLFWGTIEDQQIKGKFSRLTVVGIYPKSLRFLNSKLFAVSDRQDHSLFGCMFVEWNPPPIKRLLLNYNLESHYDWVSASIEKMLLQALQMKIFFGYLFQSFALKRFLLIKYVKQKFKIQNFPSVVYIKHRY